ncbi:MAG: hypothetical protein HQK56_17805, partial [Deltaproteobacteria bacterium]|nr:hypothetical protein [Deltaproteobacteria bacterium]
MKKYLLDSNIVSYMNDPESPFFDAVNKRLETTSDQDKIMISILTPYEHDYGIAKADDGNDAGFVDKVKKTYDAMIDSFPIVPLSLQGAKEFGKLKNEYRKKAEKTGISKGNLRKKLKGDTVDLIMAGSAMAE